MARAAGVAHRCWAGAPAAPLAAGGGVQADGHIEVLRGSPEGFVFRAVVAPVLLRVLGYHCRRHAQFGAALQLGDSLGYVVQVDHCHALEPVGVAGAEFRQPVVVDAEDGRHQARVGDLEIEQALRWVQQFAGDSIYFHVADVLGGVIPSDMNVLEAAVGGNLLRVLEAGAPRWR